MVSVCAEEREEISKKGRLTLPQVRVDFKVQSGSQEKESESLGKQESDFDQMKTKREIRVQR